MIHYLKGDATDPVGDGRKIIAHVCNDRGGWGAGFVLALSAKWDAPANNYSRHHKMRGLFLGSTHFTVVEPDISVANMVAQSGYVAKDRPVALDYVALGACLDELEAEAVYCNASVHMPRIGCGLAGGDWERVEPLILAYLSYSTEVYVYDLA